MPTTLDSGTESMRRASRVAAPAVYHHDLMKEDEDWRSIPDGAERRKIQNRIAQRQYRRSLRARKLEIEQLKQQLQGMQESHHGSETTHHSQHGTTAEASARPAPVQEQQHKSGRDSQRQPTTKSANSAAAVTTGQRSLLTPPSQSEDEAVLRISSQTAPQLHSGVQAPVLSNGNIEDRPVILASTACPVPLLASSIAIPDNGLSILDTQADGGERRWEDSWAWTPLSSTNSAPQVRMLTPPPILLEPAVPPPQQGVSMLEANTSALQLALQSRQGSMPTLEPNTPVLHMAILSSNLDILKLLLRDDEIFIDERDGAGFTPLQRAIFFGRSDMVAMLLEHGASVLSDR